MEQKVSVIIPVYNAEHMLGACLESVLSQTFSDTEIIVVDDGSTDRTAEICDEFQKNHSCIKVIHKKNSGVSAARNTALEVAIGDYIVFVDSDDTVKPDYIEELMKWSDYDFVTAGYNWQTPDLIWEKREFEDNSISQDELRAYPSKYMGKYYFGSPWATLMKNSIIKDVGLRFNEEIRCGEDILFIFQYLQFVKKIKILPFCGYNYYFYTNSLVNTKHQDFWKWKIQIESEIWSFFKPCDEKEKGALLSRSFDVLRDLLRDYSRQMTNDELLTIYRNPFFENAIWYKSKNGSIKDRILIFSMEHRNYQIYVRMNKICYLIQRGKNKLKRTFGK